jgi:hypothetical protein
MFHVAAVLVFAMIGVGLVGTLRSEAYVAESAALLLVGMAIVLRYLTWGRPRGDD